MPSSPGYGGRPREILSIDQDQAVNLNVASAPLEWLAAKGKLETKDDEPGQGLMRFAIAMHLRRIVEGGLVSGLKSQNLEGASGGGAGARPVSDFKLDCMWQIDRVRHRMHPGLHRLLTKIVVDDVWLWEMPKPMNRRLKLMAKRKAATNTRAQKRIDRQIAKEIAKEQRYLIEKLLKAIDDAGVALGYITERQFRERWSRRRPAAKSA
jgi:hypothetical protein